MDVVLLDYSSMYSSFRIRILVLPCQGIPVAAFQEKDVFISFVHIINIEFGV